MGKCMTVYVTYYMHTGPEENLDRYILLQSLIVSLLLYSHVHVHISRTVLLYMY